MCEEECELVDDGCFAGLSVPVLVLVAFASIGRGVEGVPKDKVKAPVAEVDTGTTSFAPVFSELAIAFFFFANGIDFGGGSNFCDFPSGDGLDKTPEAFF